MTFLLKTFETVYEPSKGLETFSYNQIMRLNDSTMCFLPRQVYNINKTNYNLVLPRATKSRILQKRFSILTGFRLTKRKNLQIRLGKVTGFTETPSNYPLQKSKICKIIF